MKQFKRICLGLIIAIITTSICLNPTKNNEELAEQKDNFIEISEIIEESKINEKIEYYQENNVESIQELSQITYEKVDKNEIISDDFMNEYFEKAKEIEEIDKKDNILIITSEVKIEEDYGASKVVEAPNNQYFLQFDSEEEKNNALEIISEEEIITDIEENIAYTIMKDEYYSWGIEKIGLNQAIEVANSKGLNQVTVAILDTGCNMELFNQSFLGKIEETYNAIDPEAEMNDEDGHGTHIAGTIAEGTPENVKILPVKVTNGETMYSTDIINAINYIVYYKKADIINMSFGSYSESNSFYQAINSANEANIICVAAAGNDGISDKIYPAAYDNTISMAACDPELNWANFSNFGSSITFTAPGVAITSINGIMSGTSMATPHGSCAVAVLKSYNKNYTLENIIDILKMYAIDLGEKGRDDYFGYGLINFKDITYCNCNCEKCDSIYCDGCECEECIFNTKIKSVNIHIEKNEYVAFETVDTQGMYIVVEYENGQEEIINDNITIIYNNQNDSFRCGDTYFTATAYSNKNVYIEANVNVVVTKAIPTYIVPINIVAEIGQKLSDIVLPKGFKWMEKELLIDQLGSIIFKVRYTPEDIVNYDIVENIEVIVLVNEKTTVITYSANNYEGIYDGNEHSITLNINIPDYNIVYSINDLSYNLSSLPNFKDIGEYTINYKISSNNYEDTIGSNTVKIYGIKDIDPTMEIRDNILVIKNYNNNFTNICNRINIFSPVYTFKHYESNNITESENTKTGDSIKININNEIDYTYLICVLGDVNGDGKISALDYVKIKNHIMQSLLINSNVSIIAADVNDDGKISALDYVRVKNYIMNVTRGT